jgi:predicted branched-subunit amino acid permease
MISMDFLYIVIASLVGAVVALLLPGLNLVVGIAIGAGCGVALAAEAATRRARGGGASPP